MKYIKPLISSLQAMRLTNNSPMNTFEVTICLYYFPGPDHSGHVYTHEKISFPGQPTWTTEVECLTELQKHIPQFDIHSEYVVRSSKIESEGQPPVKLEGSLWPEISADFLPTDKGHHSWTFTELPYSGKTAEKLKSIDKRLDVLTETVNELAAEVKRGNDQMIWLLKLVVNNSPGGCKVSLK